MVNELCFRFDDDDDNKKYTYGYNHAKRNVMLKTHSPIYCIEDNLILDTHSMEYIWQLFYMSNAYR